MTNSNDAGEHAGGQGGSWWRSLPGVLTAVGTLVTAVAGLIAGLNLHGHRSETPTVIDAGTPGQVDARDAPPGPPVPHHVSPKPMPASHPHPGASETVATLIVGRWTWSGQACAQGPRISSEGGNLIFSTPSTRFVHRILSDGQSSLRTRVLTPPEHAGDVYSFRIDGATLRVFEEATKETNFWSLCK